MAATFELRVLDVVKISLAAHACLLLRSLLGKLVDWLVPALSSCWPCVRRFHCLHKRLPDMLPRVLSEQVSLITVSTLALMALSHTSVSLVPFGHQPTPTPHFLIRLVLCACAARYAVLALRLLLGREMVVVAPGTLSKASGVAVSGESGLLLWDFLYACVCATNSLLCLGYRQNLLLGMTFIFVELSYLPVSCCHLLQVADDIRHAQQPRAGCGGLIANRYVSLTYRRCALLACAISIVSRGGLPVLFLALSLQRESPLVMDRVLLIWFSVSGLLLLAYQWMLIYRSVRRLSARGERANYLIGSRHGSGWLEFSPLTSDPGGCWGGAGFDVTNTEESMRGDRRGCMDGVGARIGHVANTPGGSHFLSIQDHPDTLTNDIQDDIAAVKRSLAVDHVRMLDDVNYGLLRPYDNRNVSCCSSYSNHDHAINFTEADQDSPFCSSAYGRRLSHGEEKTNITRKKETTKTWLTYKLLTDSLPCSSLAKSSNSCAFTVPSSSTAQVMSVADLDPTALAVLLGANAKLQGQHKLHQGTNMCGESESERFPLSDGDFCSSWTRLPPDGEVSKSSNRLDDANVETNNPLSRSPVSSNGLIDNSTRLAQVMGSETKLWLSLDSEENLSETNS